MVWVPRVRPAFARDASIRPKDECCPAGVEANLLMLGETLSKGGNPDSLRLALAFRRRYFENPRRPEGHG